MAGRVDDLIAEAREFLVTPNLGKSLMRELDKAMIYIRRLVDVLEVSLGERDAAVAAIERVRAIVSDPCTEGCCDFCEGKNEGWEMVLQALDGAPEPEEKP